MHRFRIHIFSAFGAAIPPRVYRGLSRKVLGPAMSKRTYRDPEPVSESDAMAIIACDDPERLRTLPIDGAFHMASWRFIQDICVRLSQHRDAWVRSNSLLGLAHVARFHGKVEKNVVKPVLLRALRDNDPRVAAVARDVIADINLVMRVHIGGAAKQKRAEARYENRRNG